MNHIGVVIDRFLFKDHQKISDLVKYEGPILSHFQNKSGEDFLYYWIDGDDNFYRWLIMKVARKDLQKYLTKRLSLLEIVQMPYNTYLFVADIDKNYEFTRTAVVEARELSQEFLPPNESTYEFEIPTEYKSLFGDELQASYYIDLLKETGFYLKIESNDLKHARTFSASEIGQALTKINSSYEAYLSNDFELSFRERFADLDELKQTANRVGKDLELRIVDLQAASFGVLFSSDPLAINESSQIADWSRAIVLKYRKEVFELDTEDQRVISRLSDKYEVGARRKIFKPIWDLFSDHNLSFSTADSFRDKVKRVARPKLKLAKAFFADNVELEKPPTPKEFVTTMSLVEKGGKPSRVPLFEERSSEITIHLPELEAGKEIVELKSEIQLSLAVKGADLFITILGIEGSFGPFNSQDEGIDSIAQHFLDAHRLAEGGSTLSEGERELSRRVKKVRRK